MLPAYLVPAAMLASAAANPLFGAIAIDMNDPTLEPAYGWAINQPDRATAESVALKNCRKYADDDNDCQAIVWFDGCGAYVNSDTTYGYGYGPDERTAKGKASQMCSENGESCYVVIAVCNDIPSAK